MAEPAGVAAGDDAGTAWRQNLAPGGTRPFTHRLGARPSLDIGIVQLLPTASARMRSRLLVVGEALRHQILRGRGVAHLGQFPCRTLAIKSTRSYSTVMTDAILALRLDPTRPIYIQIVEGVTRLAALGELAPGEALPSVRQMAEHLRVNPNTVQRAYRDLEASGVAESRPGQGTFVRADVAGLTAVRERLAADIAGKAVRELGILGLRPEEIAKLVARVLARGKEGEQA